MRRAFSLVEVVVAMTIAVLLIVIAYNVMVLMVRSEKAIDRDSLRAINESTLMQTLLMDLRSSHKDIDDRTAGSFKITRFVSPPGGGALVEQAVTWTVDDKRHIVTRAVNGEDPIEFSFAGQLDARSPAVSLRISRETELLFAP